MAVTLPAAGGDAARTAHAIPGNPESPFIPCFPGLKPSPFGTKDEGSSGATVSNRAHALVGPRCVSYRLQVLRPHHSPWRLLASLQTCLWAVLVLCLGNAFGSIPVESAPLHLEETHSFRDSAEDGRLYLRARWMDPNTGRFVSEDPLQGELNMPLTQHRFHYVGSSPINFVDPSGEMLMAAELAGRDVLGEVWSTLTSFAASIGRNLISRTIVKSAVVLGAGALTAVMARKLAASYAAGGVAKNEIEMKAKEYQKSLGILPEDGSKSVLYHYTNKDAALNIFTQGYMKVTAKYLPARLPAGAYTTDIAPWDMTYTQKQLSALFYGGNVNQDVSHFVAIRNDFAWRNLSYQGRPREWVKEPFDNSGLVEVDPVLTGVNLMLKGD